VTGHPIFWEVPWPLWPIAGVSGLIGAFFDSLLGASVQRMYLCGVCNKETEQSTHHCGSQSLKMRGWSWIDNDVVNFISSAAGALVAAALTLWLV
jgi:uncharacterized membrane protein